MKNPELSLIICTFNRADRLSQVIDDLKKQELPERDFKWEIIIVDNNSTDQTSQLIQKVISSGDLPVDYQFEPKQGKSYALNTGIKASKSRLLAFTDDDVSIPDKWISTVYRAFITYPYNCFGGKVLPVLEGPLPEWLTEKGSFAFHGGPIVKHDKGNHTREYDESMWVPLGANMFLRKSLFDKYGYFNTTLGFYSKDLLLYGEDTELMYRFKNKGEKICYYPQALIYHPVQLERLKKSHFRRYFWGAGCGRARWEKIPPQAIRYNNIPRYLIKQAFLELIHVVTAIPSSKKYKKFFYEAMLLYYLGMIYDYYMNSD